MRPMTLVALDSVTLRTEDNDGQSKSRAPR